MSQAFTSGQSGFERSHGGSRRQVTAPEHPKCYSWPQQGYPSELPSTRQQSGLGADLSATTAVCTAHRQSTERPVCSFALAKPQALVATQIWDVDEGGAAPADLAMPGIGVGMSHTSARDFHDLVTASPNSSHMLPCTCVLQVYDSARSWPSQP